MMTMTIMTMDVDVDVDDDDNDDDDDVNDGDDNDDDDDDDHDDDDDDDDNDDDDDDIDDDDDDDTMTMMTTSMTTMTMTMMMMTASMTMTMTMIVVVVVIHCKLQDSVKHFNQVPMCCSSESPVLWVRIDPDVMWLRHVTFEQPDYMWQYQLRHERDVMAQSQVRSFDCYQGASGMFRPFLKKKKNFLQGSGKHIFFNLLQAKKL